MTDLRPNETCSECVKETTPNKEPLIPTPLPEYQKVGSDFFTLIRVNYRGLLSRYPEVVMLISMTSQAVIKAMTSMLACFGIAEIVVSDNGHSIPHRNLKTLPKSTTSSEVCSDSKDF